MSDQKQRGSLSPYFTGVAVKRLSAVESNPNKSNQHELNGVQDLKKILGEERRENIPANFVYLADAEDKAASAEGFVTWYDAREKHPRRSEHRLYFATNAVMEEAAEGDLIFVCQRTDNTALLIVTRNGSTSANQVLWLFALSAPAAGFDLQTFEHGETSQAGADFIRRMILEQVGIESAPAIAEQFLPALLEAFGSEFPTTRQFSAFARATVEGVSATDGPDDAVMAWMEQEEDLFRTLERHIVSERLETGFGTDVDAFVEFSLSVQNRRKSRVGYALENHLEYLFIQNKIPFSRGKVTERNSRPDFIFPGIIEYRDQGFLATRLSMLGVKSTCKDRWRQVLAEADRIRTKHLLTLEPGISSNQTSEMQSQSLQLVLPSLMHSTYNAEQQGWLMTLREFLDHVKWRAAET